MSYQTRDGKTRVSGGWSTINTATTEPATWRDSYKHYEQRWQYVREKRAIMSALERQEADEALNAELESVLGRASGGMEREILEVAEKVKRRESTLKSYKQAEAESWDSGKQQVAYIGIGNRLAEAAADNITGGQQFKAIYEDAKNSKYALLAFSELMPKYARAKSDPQLNSLAVQASQQVRELRNTPDILDKQSQLNEAVIELGDKLKEANKIHQVLYGGNINDPLHVDSLARAARRIAWSESGELEVLPPDDSRVTGVYYGRSTVEAIGG